MLISAIVWLSRRCVLRESGNSNFDFGQFIPLEFATAGALDSVDSPQQLMHVSPTSDSSPATGANFSSTMPLRSSSNRGSAAGVTAGSGVAAKSSPPRAMDRDFELHRPEVNVLSWLDGSNGSAGGDAHGMSSLRPTFDDGTGFCVRVIAVQSLIPALAVPLQSLS